MSDHTDPPPTRAGLQPGRRGTNIRLPAEVLERLHAEADARMVSVNWLVNRAVVDFLERLIPVEEFKLTRD